MYVGLRTLNFVFPIAYSVGISYHLCSVTLPLKHKDGAVLNNSITLFLEGLIEYKAMPSKMAQVS